MKGFRAGVWAMIGLAAVLAFSAAAPVGRAQVAGGPTTPLLDDFERPNENPLSGGGNWAKLFPVSSELQLLDNGVATAISGSTAPRRYWTPATFGPDAEVYARTSGTGGWHQDIRLGLRLQNVGTSSFTGYELIGPWNGITGYRWVIRRHNGGSFTDLRNVDGPASPNGSSFARRAPRLRGGPPATARAGH